MAFTDILEFFATEHFTMLCGEISAKGFDNVSMRVSSFCFVFFYFSRAKKLKLDCINLCFIIIIPFKWPPIFMLLKVFEIKYVVWLNKYQFNEEVTLCG